MKIEIVVEMRMGPQSGDWAVGTKVTIIPLISLSKFDWASFDPGRDELSIGHSFGKSRDSRDLHNSKIIRREHELWTIQRRRESHENTRLDVP